MQCGSCEGVRQVPGRPLGPSAHRLCLQCAAAVSPAVVFWLAKQSAAAGQLPQDSLRRGTQAASPPCHVACSMPCRCLHQCPSQHSTQGHRKFSLHSLPQTKAACAVPPSVMLKLRTVQVWRVQLKPVTNKRQGLACCCEHDSKGIVICMRPSRLSHHQLLASTQ